MAVVDGKWSGDTFSSSNGWDGYYYSSPVMKVNLAVGAIQGSQSDNKVYMDSVIYSYDEKQFQIIDELEDDSPKADGNPKGSQLFTEFKETYKEGTEAWRPEKTERLYYYEYDAKAGNFTGSENDYLLINRSTIRSANDYLKDKQQHIAATVIAAEKNDKNYDLKAHHDYADADWTSGGSPFTLTALDTDKDSTVAEYTGEHEIEYANPKVLAVLAAAPYFKDTANYDDGDKFNWGSTSFGKSTGTSKGYTESLDFQYGIVINTEVEIPIVDIKWENSDATGYAMSEEWGYSDDREFSLEYETSGGGDAVVLFSTPSENFKYKLHGIAEDDDGNTIEVDQDMVITNPHQPVTQTLDLDDYEEIQSRYQSQLPKVSDYLTSTPGDPASYPSSASDLSDETKAKLGDTQVGDEWSGIAYGDGTVTQGISLSHTESKQEDNKADGSYVSFEETFGTDSFNIGIGIDRSHISGGTYETSTGSEYSGTVSNLPDSARGYGYDFSWKLFEYIVEWSDDCHFPVITYMTDDVTQPPLLPDDITQDFDNTTDSQAALTWTYEGSVQEFDVYKYFDFPQGGGEQLVGRVSGSDYTIEKDDNGKTITDDSGAAIHRYTFIDKDLTADTKYNYRIQVRRTKVPNESILSEIIEARTDVSNKPDVQLSSDKMKIYPDGTQYLRTIIDNPDSYEGTINYQWQKYNPDTRKWEDVAGCKSAKLAFYNCSEDDEGTYRCRLNLVRKVEGNPEYISVYTGACDVEFSLRDVDFGPISVFDEGTGKTPKTGISVTVKNSDSASLEKPTGQVKFTITGQGHEIHATAGIDEKTGEAKVTDIEGSLGTTGAMAFGNGGYVVTARYKGSKIFYPQTDKEEYHYLRNIDEALFLSANSSYLFGEDILSSARLYDYKSVGGKIQRTDKTDEVKRISFFAADGEDQPTGSAVKTYDMSDLSASDGQVNVPLNKALVKKGCIAVYTDDSDTPAAVTKIKTRKMTTSLTLKSKTTGTGSGFAPYTWDEVEVSGDGDLTTKNIMTSDGDVSLSEMLKINYYEDNGDLICSSADVDQHIAEFIPAVYKASLADLNTDYKYFYKDIEFNTARLYVAGNYYRLSALCDQDNTGVVKMLTPQEYTDPSKVGFTGGTKVSFKAEPKRGYKVTGWQINECGEIKTVEANDGKLTYVVKNGNSDPENDEIIIKAIMAPKDNTLVYDAVGQGTVKVSPEVRSGSTVIADTNLTFTATPARGWQFKEWRWANEGGSTSVARGTIDDKGSSVKKYVMADNPVTVHAIFTRDTIDVDHSEGLDISFINDGSLPQEETGKEIKTEDGQGVPKGTEVIVRGKDGYEIADDAEWKITIKANDEEYSPEITRLEEGNGCSFKLPADVESCNVEVAASKGEYTISAEADKVDFTVKVNGRTVKDGGLSGIPSGTGIEITAAPQRGYVMDKWVINGEKISPEDDLTYTCSLTSNMRVSAVLSEDEEVNVSLSSNGGGSGEYIITDKNGETHEGTFGDEAATPTAYKGESLLVTADPEQHYTLKSVKLNGTEQNLEDGDFQIESLDGDAELVCGFTPSTYYSATFRQDVLSTNPTISYYDDDRGEYVQVKDGESIKLPYDKTLKFNVEIKRTFTSHVMQNDKILEYKDKIVEEETTTFVYEAKISENTTFTVADYDNSIREVGTAEELEQYFSDFQNIDGGISARLTADIDASSVELDAHSGALRIFKGTFDGQGHTISNLNLGSADDPAVHRGFFGSIDSSATIKNVTFDNCKVYTDKRHPGLLAEDNDGHITDVVLNSCEVHSLDKNDEKYRIGGVVYCNNGTIERVVTRKLKLEALLASGDRMNEPGSAIAALNQVHEGKAPTSTVKNCYSIHTQTIGRQGTMEQGTGVIGYTNNGIWKDNYYLVKEQTDTFAPADMGTNVTDLTGLTGLEAYNAANTPAFNNHIAYQMNKDAKAEVWGTTSTGSDNMIVPLAAGGDNAKAPVKVDFEGLNDNTKTLYLYPTRYSLPSSDSFGEDTPKYWINGDTTYDAGFNYVELNEDAVFTGSDTLPDGIKIYMTSGGTHSSYFNNMEDAVKMYKSGIYREAITFDIRRGTVELNERLVIDENTVMVVRDGASLTLGKDSTLIIKGTFACRGTSRVDKYGVIKNMGKMHVESFSFYNYGSKLINDGDITYQGRIICKPHRTGEWTYAQQPNDDGSWNKTAHCEVCDKDVTVTEEAEDLIKVTDKSGKEVKHTELNRNDSVELTAGLISNDRDTKGIAAYKWESSDENIAAIAAGSASDSRLLTGTGDGKATVTVTALDASGNVVPGVAVKTVEVAVKSRIVDVKIQGGDRDMKSGQEEILQAKVLYEDTKESLTWSSSDESVASVAASNGGDANGGFAGLVTAKAGGSAVITATAPSGISASVVVNVTEGAQTLELSEDEVSIITDGTAPGHEVLAAMVKPATANGKVEWTVDDSSVAGFCQTDEETGETKIVDKITTDLSADGQGYSDTYVILAGSTEGVTRMYASTEGADGKVLKTMGMITVREEAAEYVEITQNGVTQSGAMLNVDLQDRSLAFGTNLGNDRMTWSVIDDRASSKLGPVMDVNDEGLVTFNRTGTAILKVESAGTGTMDACYIRVKRGADGLTLSDSSIRLAKDDSQTLHASLTPADAESRIIWSSSDEKVATVDAKGRVTAVGEGTATIKARPDRAGAEAASCEVTGYEAILNLTFDQDEFIYDKKSHRPAVTVRSGSTVLAENITESTDAVELVYSGDLRTPGEYKVMAAATDKAYGHGSAVFQIKVKPTSITKIYSGKKQLKVKWKKVGKTYINGYQIRYSTNEDMSSAKKTSVTKYKTTSKTIKKLKAKKNYYVQVRTYVKRGGKKYYSDWSLIKVRKTK